MAIEILCPDCGEIMDEYDGGWFQCDQMDNGCKFDGHIKARVT